MNKTNNEKVGYWEWLGENIKECCKLNPLFELLCGAFLFVLAPLVRLIYSGVVLLGVACSFFAGNSQHL